VCVCVCVLCIHAPLYYYHHHYYTHTCLFILDILYKQQQHPSPLQRPSRFSGSERLSMPGTTTEMRSAYIITSKGTLDAYELGARRRGISTRHRQKYLNSSSVHSFFISCSPQQQQQQPHPISPRVLRLKSIASDAAVLNRLISSFFHSRSIVHTNNKHKNGLCSSISTVPSRAFA
jgi:hypothetical protein